ncbi:anti-sigma factor [Gracilibacillus caseinilyticus]|uniref:Anti-sigma-W factor RsiW n=1 Tax=Gracilibacillus caseinilyticus TaxID=2932256 RepID=A0ABY4EYA3_9BACI|nr:anti-sigma factor [Gracilibacillus caseinilyticus]UOQ49386.1 anti-sigma factor [Gracilibacillus caseinilyticus]
MNKQCEKVIDYFNDQLTEIDKKQFEEHLATCDACQEELKELQELTEDLPFISEPVTPNEGMKDRVLGNILQEEQEKTDEAATPNFKPKPQSKRKYQTWIQNGLAAALLLSLIGNIYLLNQPADNPDSETAATIDEIINSVSLEDTEIMNAAGRASIVQNNGEKVLLVQAENLQKIEGDQAYQVWLLEDDKPYRAGTFVPNQAGEGAVAFSLSELEKSNVNWDTIAITLEPSADNQEPQGDIILAAGIES